ncbi:unnamed protein product [Dibothriocephalus latus]|uniref:Uncharacterized protein n=1 Tax=Dibothriocephalus latus TaxID=60516 RepID=A0A3P7Q7M2_DIBLA|nr:unnamed protein product [Dibothriocephalus latus]
MGDASSHRHTLGQRHWAIITALAIPHWSCGNLFENFSRGYDRETIFAVAALLIIGLAFLIIIFIIDLVLICSSVMPAGLITARFVLLYLGTAPILTAVIVFTARRNGLWSHFLAVIGAIFAVLVAILAIMTSRKRSLTEALYLNVQCRRGQNPQKTCLPIPGALLGLARVGLNYWDTDSALFHPITRMPWLAFPNCRLSLHPHWCNLNQSTLAPEQERFSIRPLSRVKATRNTQERQEWGCGNLLKSCADGRDRDIIIAVAALLLIGLACLIIIFVIDLVLICSSVVPAGLITTRFLILYLGVALIVSGILLFTAKINHRWSYFLAVVGGVFSVLVAILALMTSRCVTRTERVIVRTTH